MKLIKLTGIVLISLLAILTTAQSSFCEEKKPQLKQGPQNKQHNYKHPEGQHRFKNAETWVKRFESRERDEWQKPEAVIKALELTGNEIVADIGSATGYFPVRFAKALPKGRVYGIDIEKGMVGYLNDRAKREGLSNLSSILGEPDNPKLPEQVDMVFICNTYHHIENRQHYFDTLKKSISAEGKLVIIDFLKGSIPVGPPDSMKLAAESVISELSGAGYRLVQKPEILPYQYVLIFQTAE